MSRQIKTTGKLLPRIRTTSQRLPRVDPSMVARALGAEANPASAPTLQGSPPALLALRQKLCEQLRSTGGRRSLTGVTRRQKIPLSEADWKRLQSLAERSQTKGVRPTPGQVASLLLHQALDSLERGIAQEPVSTQTENHENQ